MIHLVNSENRHLYRSIIQETFKVRHEVFVEGRGWSALARPDKIERDQFDDEHACYLIRIDGDGHPIGGMRLLRTDKPYLLKNVLTQYITMEEPPEDPDIYEISRFWVHPKLNRTAGVSIVWQDLQCALAEFAIRLGISRFIHLTDMFLHEKYCQMDVSIQELGLPTKYDEGVAIASYLRIPSDFYATLQSNLVGPNGNIIIQNMERTILAA